MAIKVGGDMQECYPRRNITYYMYSTTYMYSTVSAVLGARTHLANTVRALCPVHSMTMRAWCEHPVRIFRSCITRSEPQMIGNACTMRTDRRGAFKKCAHYRRTCKCVCNIMRSQ
jgi:hypothetical protein